MSFLAKSVSMSVMFLSKISDSNPSSIICERTFAAVAFATNSSCLLSIPGAGQISISKSMIRIFPFLNSLKTPS